MPSSQISPADLKHLVFLKSITELRVNHIAEAAAAPPGAADGGSSTTHPPSLSWLAQPRTLQQLRSTGKRWGVLIPTPPALTCLTYLDIYSMDAKDQDQVEPLPLNQLPTTAGAALSGCDAFDRALFHLGSCGPLTALTRLDLR